MHPYLQFFSVCVGHIVFSLFLSARGVWLGAGILVGKDFASSCSGSRYGYMTDWPCKNEERNSELGGVVWLRGFSLFLLFFFSSPIFLHIAVFPCTILVSSFPPPSVSVLPSAVTHM